MYYDERTKDMVKEILYNLSEEYKKGLGHYVFCENQRSPWLSNDAYSKAYKTKYHFGNLHISGEYDSANQFHYNIQYGVPSTNKHIRSFKECIYTDGLRPDEICPESYDWKTMLSEIYNSIDYLKKSQIAMNDFFNRIANDEYQKDKFWSYKYTPKGNIWPKALNAYDYHPSDTIYIKGLDITTFIKLYYSDCDYHCTIAKIYHGQTCVYSSDYNLFVDGPWKEQLIQFSLRKDKRIKEKDFNDNLNAIKLLRKK